MIQTTCPFCGGKTLLPDPPAKTRDENIQFRKDWDERFEARS